MLFHCLLNILNFHLAILIVETRPLSSNNNNRHRRNNIEQSLYSHESLFQLTSISSQGFSHHNSRQLDDIVLLGFFYQPCFQLCHDVFINLFKPVVSKPNRVNMHETLTKFVLRVFVERNF